MTNGSSKTPKEGVSQFKGPVLFVNHGIGNLKSAPHRHEVFTHVQNNYRRWRRREDARAIRAGVTLPTTFGPERAGRTRRSSSDTSSSGSSSSPNDPYVKEALRRAELEEAHRKALSPVNLVRKGNSDPFSTYAFDIDPQANELIAFWRDQIIPGVYHISRRKSLSHANAQRDFKDVVDSLSDRGGAYSVLARSAFIASHTKPEMAKSALVYVDKSVKVLKDKVAKGEDLQDPKIYWQVMNLMAAEALAGNADGADAHGKILRHLFEQQAKLGKMDIKNLLYAVFTDAQASAIFLKPAIFDAAWLEIVLAPMFGMAVKVAAQVYPPLPDSVYYTDPCVDDLELQDVFNRRREGMTYFNMSATQKGETPHAPLLFGWIAFRGQITQAMTMKYHLQKMEDLKVPDHTEAVRDRLYTQAYLSLAKIYIARLHSMNQAVLGVPMFNANPNILARLRRLLEESDRLPGGPSFHKYNNARLWALYIGAFGEQHEYLAKRTKAEPTEQWFNLRLAEQCYIMDVRSWAQAKPIFEGFLQNEILPPNGAMWFDRTISRQVEVAAMGAKPILRPMGFKLEDEDVKEIPFRD
jgi:hypothetical protein